MQKIHDNTCPAFFNDATIDPSGSYSPCTALGGGAFKFPNKTFETIWSSVTLEDVRKRSASGEKLSMCNRCWSEESYGHTSERQYLKSRLDADVDYTDRSLYSIGPKHLNIKVSNICNLRCRTCQSYDSYLYHIEGKHYEKKNNLRNTIYTREEFKKHFTDQQLDELYSFSDNLEKIELYGGEPFLDEQIPKLLERLIDSGRSNNIDLKVSTNATHKLNDQWKRILSNFRNVIVNISIDGIGDRFTYLRHPGDWSVAEKNIQDLINFSQVHTSLNIIPVICVSAINVWYVNEVFDYFAQYNVTPFIILVQWPSYYCVNVFPKHIKEKISNHLTKFNSIPSETIINLMNTEPKSFTESTPTAETPWEEFKFWTKEKDLYRKENYNETFKEFSELLDI